MLTKDFTTAFKLLLLALFVALFAACKPPGPKALLDGTRLLENGRVEAAVARLQVATQLMPTNAHAWNYLGLACHQAGQSSNAIVAYRRALMVNADLVEARFNLGSLWLELGRPTEAKYEFTSYNLRRPNKPEGFNKLALAELQLREMAAAEQHIRKSLQLDAANSDSWNTLGLVQLQQRKPRDAAGSFGEALKQQADFAPALINLAVVAQQQLGDRAGALKLYRQYLALKPRPADADQVAEVAARLERDLAPVRPSPPSASNHTLAAPVSATSTQLPPVKPVVASVPSPAPVRQAVNQSPAPVTPARVSEPVPRVVRTPVEPEFKVAPVVEVALPPRSVAPPATPVPSAPQMVPPVASAPGEDQRGLLQKINPANLFRGGDKRPMVTPLPPPAEPAAAAAEGPAYQSQGAGKLDVGDRAAAEKLAARGAKAMTARRYVEASAAYGAAGKADPSWYQAHFNHAAAAIEAGQATEAISASEQALALKPNSSEARYNFALALKQAGYHRDAAAQIERLLADNPEDAQAHLTLGNLCAEQLKRPDKARSHYLKVLEINPRHPQAGAIHFWLAANPAR